MSAADDRWLRKHSGETVVATQLWPQEVVGESLFGVAANTNTDVNSSCLATTVDHISKPNPDLLKVHSKYEQMFLDTNAVRLDPFRGAGQK